MTRDGQSNQNWYLRYVSKDWMEIISVPTNRCLWGQIMFWDSLTPNVLDCNVDHPAKLWNYNSNNQFINKHTGYSLQSSDYALMAKSNQYLSGYSNNWNITLTVPT